MMDTKTGQYYRVQDKRYCRVTNVSEDYVAFHFVDLLVPPCGGAEVVTHPEFADLVDCQVEPTWVTVKAPQHG